MRGEKKKKTLKDELPRSVGAKFITREEWKNNPRKNEEIETNQKQCLVVDVIGEGSPMLKRTVLHRNLEGEVHESR